jgi:opacity protein-like surface antigen
MQRLDDDGGYPMKADAGRLAVVAACAALAVLASDAIASEESKQSWQFEFVPYLFAAGLNGSIGALGVTADVDVPIEKLIQHLDGVFMGIIEARRENWLIMFDAIYVRLEGETSSSWQGPLGISNATGELKTTIRQQVYQPSLGYRVFDDRTAVDIIGGVRYTQIDTEFDLGVTTGGLLPGGTHHLSVGKSWWDPVVGVRVTVPLAEKWSVMGYVDAGGNGSDFTYQAMAGANWQFAKNFSLKAGYRYLYQDFEDNGFAWDMALHGAYFGLGIRF